MSTTKHDQRVSVENSTNCLSNGRHMLVKFLVVKVDAIDYNFETNLGNNFFGGWAPGGQMDVEKEQKYN